MSRSAWTQLDYARAIAVEALAALKQENPGRYETLVRAAKAIHQGWVEPQPGGVPPGERIGYREASELLYVPEGTIRRWVSDPTVPVWRCYGGLDPQELLAYKASLQRQDEHRATQATELAEKYRTGATLQELADYIGRSPSYVVALLREAGVVLRRRGHR